MSDVYKTDEEKAMMVLLYHARDLLAESLTLLESAMGSIDSPGSDATIVLAQVTVVKAERFMQAATDLGGA
jgi:hypothetical protein